MVGIYLSISSMYFLVLLFIKSRNRELIDPYDLNSGKICYKCKQNLVSRDTYYVLQNAYPRMCVSCDRNSTIGRFLDKGFKFKLSTKYLHKIALSLIALSALFNIIYFFYPFFNILAGLFLFIGMWLTYISYMDMSRNRTQSRY